MGQGPDGHDCWGDKCGYDTRVSESTPPQRRIQKRVYLTIAPYRNLADKDRYVRNAKRAQPQTVPVLC
jgi:hypothetical protein